MSDDDEKKVWECPVCKACFRKYISFYSHQRVKHRPNSVDCLHCNEKFPTYATRNSHYYKAVFGETKRQKTSPNDTTKSD